MFAKAMGAVCKPAVSWLRQIQLPNWARIVRVTPELTYGFLVLISVLLPQFSLREARSWDACSQWAVRCFHSHCGPACLTLLLWLLRSFTLRNMTKGFVCKTFIVSYLSLSSMQIQIQPGITLQFFAHFCRYCSSVSYLACLEFAY